MFGPNEWAATYRSSIEKIEKKLLDKSATAKQRQEIESLLTEIKSDLAKADAGFAHTLGHPLCQCAFPGVPMLWQHQISAHVCPSCGDRRVNPQPTRVSRSYSARRVNNDWDIFTGK